MKPRGPIPALAAGDAFGAAAGGRPFIYDMPGMLELGAEIDSEVCGLLLDSYHWYTSHAAIGDILELQARQIVLVHINDAYPGPIDELLDRVSSKYALVIYAAKRARQINDYYNQLGDGILEYVGPLVEPGLQEKPLSIALREIHGDLLEHTKGE